MYDEAQLKWFDRWGKERPSQEAHGSPEEIRANLKRAKAYSWHMEGNELVADTDLGPLRQVISTAYICKGMDKEGLPILVKLDV